MYMYIFVSETPLGTCYSYNGVKNNFIMKELV